MRKYLLPSALILILGLGAALGQTILQSVQLSQDPTGSFGVGINGGLYLPGHLLFPLTPGPVPTVTGTGTPTITGTDVAGVVTMGSSATTAVVLFGRAFISVPWCVVSAQNAFTTTNIAYTLATTSISMTQNTTSGNKVNYHCVSAS